MKEGIGKDLVIRRGRLPHWQVGGRCYFVTCRALRLLSEDARKIILGKFEDEHEQRCWLHAAVVLPDHCHAILRPLPFAKNTYFDLADIMKSVKGGSSREINKLEGVSGSLWQREGYDRMLRGHLDFNEKLRYTRMNPVKLGLVGADEVYPFYTEHRRDP